MNYLGSYPVRSMGQVSVTDWVRDVVETLLIKLWLMKIPPQYWWPNFEPICNKSEDVDLKEI